MTAWEEGTEALLEHLREKGRQEGRQGSREEGMEEGREKGRVVGREGRREEGREGSVDSGVGEEEIDVGDEVTQSFSSELFSDREDKLAKTTIMKYHPLDHTDETETDPDRKAEDTKHMRMTEYRKDSEDILNFIKEQEAASRSGVVLVAARREEEVQVYKDYRSPFMFRSVRKLLSRCQLAGW